MNIKSVIIIALALVFAVPLSADGKKKKQADRGTLEKWKPSRAGRNSEA